MAKKLGGLIVGVNRAMTMAMRCMCVKFRMPLVPCLFLHIPTLDLYFIGMVFLKIRSGISIQHESPHGSAHCNKASERKISPWMLLQAR